MMLVLKLQSAVSTRSHLRFFVLWKIEETVAEAARPKQADHTPALLVTDKLEDHRGCSYTNNLPAVAFVMEEQTDKNLPNYSRFKIPSVSDTTTASGC